MHTIFCVRWKKKRDKYEAWTGGRFCVVVDFTPLLPTCYLRIIYKRRLVAPLTMIVIHAFFFFT